MADLYICPSVRWGSGSQLWLPPWMRFVVSVSQRLTIREPAGAARALIASIETNQGSNLELSIENYLPVGANTAAVLDWQRVLWTAMAGKKFILNYYSTEAWENCALADFRYPIGQDPLTKMQYSVKDTSFAVFCEYAQPSKSAGISFANLAAYEAGYPFASVVGRPGGTVSDTDPAELAPMVIPFEQAFPGGADFTTPAGQEIRYTVPGSASNTYRVSHAKITTAIELTATGTTTIRISDFAIGGSGNSITASVADDEGYSAQGADYFDVAGGSTLYVAITAAGGHANTSFRFDVEAQ